MLVLRHLRTKGYHKWEPSVGHYPFAMIIISGKQANDLEADPEKPHGFTSY